MVLAIEQNVPFNLTRFVSYYSGSNDNDPNVDFAEWRWLGRLIIEAMKKEHEAIVPQMPALLFRDELNPTNASYIFEQDKAKAIFGSDLPMILSAINETPIPTYLEPQYSQYMKNIKQEVKILLSKKSK